MMPLPTLLPIVTVEVVAEPDMRPLFTTQPLHLTVSVITKASPGLQAMVLVKNSSLGIIAAALFTTTMIGCVTVVLPITPAL